MSSIYSPKEITRSVENLLNKLNAEFEPEQVNVVVETYAKINNCYNNVEEKVKRDGGKVHYGWAIFQTDIICEAIRHAVWETDEDDLIDITPWTYHCDSIMFVSDNTFEYSGQLVDNIRVNSTDNPLVDDFIKVLETLEKFYTLGERINDNEMLLPEPARTLVYQYENLKKLFQIYIGSGARPRSVCFCGGKKQYNNCHGKSLRDDLEVDLKSVFKKK